MRVLELLGRLSAGAETGVLRINISRLIVRLLGEDGAPPESKTRIVSCAE